ncbi:MAG: response regulator, partial [Candidatus Competibacteraceae bacterium]|nr:response regulator [Candidatus Competibacteraceae bacterium]
DKNFDPLEMDQYDELYSTTRSFIESVVDSQRMSQQMRAELTSLERSLAPLQHMKDELQTAVMKTRMEPVNTIVARLQRSVRQAARATDKQVDLFIKGSEIQIDSEVLERLADPLMHMLRNAVDHGIELPADRTAKGKSATGTIRLSFYQEGQNVVVECRDDGRGLDYERIRTTAIARGLLASGATMSNPELARLILAPGFSTRTSATQLSGRGVGMDIVQTTIRELKGIMEIGDAETGGCQISLRLPITLLTSHSLVVQVAAERYAIPTSSIMQVLSPRLGRYTLVGDQLAYEIGQDAYPATTLSACLGYAEEGGLPSPECSTVMIYSDAGPVAVAVDNLVKSYDLVVKNLGRYVGDVRGVAGLSTLADGSLIPVLDVAELLRAPAQAFAGAAAGATADVQRPTAARILIVDDSISVRQTLTDLVEEAGYEALVARDGIEAVDLLRKQKPDLVLSDIEMPRMNGLELLSYIRTSHSADLPIIMITSRTMQKHRQQAAAAGANGYVTKPFDEDELLASIRSFIQ